MKPTTVVVPSPVTVNPAIPVSPAVQIIPRFPPQLTLTSVMEQPTPGQGFADFMQTILIPANDFDASAKPTAIRVRFPASGSDQPSSTTEFLYKDGFSGSLIATPGHFQGLPLVSISWKDAGSSFDLLEMKLDPGAGRKPALALAWKTGGLLKHPDIGRLVYWLMQQSTVEVVSSRAGEVGQKIAFKEPELPTIALMDESAPLGMPPFPNDVIVIAPGKSTLPSGWEATWYTEWDEKDLALRTPANASQVIKFHKATGVDSADAWFLVRFGPGFAKVDNTLAKQIADAKGKIADNESDLRDIDRQIEDAKRVSGGKLPDTDSARMLTKRHEDAAALIDAYKAAIAGYNDIQGFDVQFSLPDGVRLATIKFSRGK